MFDPKKGCVETWSSTVSAWRVPAEFSPVVILQDTRRKLRRDEGTARSAFVGSKAHALAFTVTEDRKVRRQESSARSASGRPQNRKSKTMTSRKKVDADNPEWTQDDFAKAKAPEDVLPADVLAKFGKHRGPQKAPKKVPVSIRLSPMVVTHFRDQGPRFGRLGLMPF